MRTVVKFMKPHAWLVAFGILCKLIGAFAELAIPRVLATMIDEIVPSGDMSRVIIGGVVMLVLAFFTLIFNVIGNRVSGTTSGLIAYDLREALFEKTVKLDSAVSDKVGTASLTSRLTSDTYNITSFFTRLQRVGIRGPMMLLGGIVMTLTVDVRLAGILILILPVVAIVVYTISRRSVPIYNQEQRILDRIVRRVEETSSGIRVIKALSKTEYERERFSEASGELSDKEIYAGRLMSATKPLTDLLLNLGFCLVVLVGALLAEHTGYAATGALLAFMTYFTLILNSTILMTRIFVQMSKSVASAARIEEILLAETELSTVDTEELDTDDYIRFEGVSFSYNKKRFDVQDISFGIGRGKTLGIIGGTGSGKSTLVNLLLRLYDADEGRIFIGGRDVRSIPEAELHSMFGVAFQNDFVFAGSIRDNVALFRDGELDKAISTAQAEGFVSALEDGVEHSLTTRGTNISGGQRQRLLIARALFGNPDILILDDASSALDYRTDAALRRAIRQSVSSTTVIIAQRISSIMNADRIIFLDEGRVIGSGTHAELMESLPAYRSIAEMQMGGVSV